MVVIQLSHINKNCDDLLTEERIRGTPDYQEIDSPQLNSLGTDGVSWSHLHFNKTTINVRGKVSFNMGAWLSSLREIIVHFLFLTHMCHRKMIHRKELLYWETQGNERWTIVK